MQLPHQRLVCLAPSEVEGRHVAADREAPQHFGQHRLEEAGFHSLEQLLAIGIPEAVLTVCGRMGTVAWANRRHALEQALQQTLATGRDHRLASCATEVPR